ncbi:MAG: hypothetical protein AAF280_13220 [Pseudomonadota bacterium]
MFAIDMQENRSLVHTLWNRCHAWFTFYHQRRHEQRAHNLMVTHLIRIATLSPHLLRDMGFEKVTDQTAPHLQTLRKWPITVSIQTDPHSPEPIITITQDTHAPIDKQ